MRVTVCQLRTNPHQLEQDWKHLVEHVHAQNSDLVLLPELPFSAWFAVTDNVQPSVWDESVEQHQQWERRFAELGINIIASTRPVSAETGKYNRAFMWENGTGLMPHHDKVFLPEEDGFWEAKWYDRGTEDFQPVQTQSFKAGFMICTELWFMQHARAYSKQNVDLLLNPRCTELASIDKWLVGGQAAAVISGAYCLSSNHAEQNGAIQFGGYGWIVDPNGEVLGTTSTEQPFLTCDIDLELARQSKSTYPRYVVD